MIDRQGTAAVASIFSRMFDHLCYLLSIIPTVVDLSMLNIESHAGHEGDGRARYSLSALPLVGHILHHLI